MIERYYSKPRSHSLTGGAEDAVTEAEVMMELMRLREAEETEGETAAAGGLAVLPEEETGGHLEIQRSRSLSDLEALDGGGSGDFEMLEDVRLERNSGAKIMRQRSVHKSFDRQQLHQIDLSTSLFLFASLSFQMSVNSGAVIGISRPPPPLPPPPPPSPRPSRSQAVPRHGRDSTSTWPACPRRRSETNT